MQHSKTWMLYQGINGSSYLFSPIRQRKVFKDPKIFKSWIAYVLMLQYYSSRYFLKKNLYWNSLTPFLINWKYTVLMSELCTRRQQETVKYLSLFYPTKCKTVFDANLTMEQFASKCIFIRLPSWWPVIVSVWFEQTHSTWKFQFELPCQQSNTAPFNDII